VRQEVQRDLKQLYLKERVNVSNGRNKVWNERLQFVLHLYGLGSVPGKNHHHSVGDWELSCKTCQEK